MAKLDPPPFAASPLRPVGGAGGRRWGLVPWADPSGGRPHQRFLEISWSHTLGIGLISSDLGHEVGAVCLAEDVIASLVAEPPQSVHTPGVHTWAEAVEREPCAL